MLKDAMSHHAKAFDVVAEPMSHHSRPRNESSRLRRLRNIYIYSQTCTSAAHFSSAMSIRLTNFVFFSRMLTKPPLKRQSNQEINFAFTRRHQTTPPILCLQDLAQRAKQYYASITLRSPCPSMLVIKPHRKGQTTMIFGSLG